MDDAGELKVFRAGALCFASLAPAQPTPQPTFAHDIAPIVYRHCAPCHRLGGAGPFPLLSYEDVKKHARQIADVTQSRFMPPWLPEPGYGQFEGERRLSNSQIRTIQEWVRQQAPEGPQNEIPPAPRFVEGWQLGTPDLILRAPHAFVLPASGPDVFWNFILTPDTKTRRYVRAIEIRPGDGRLIHHANLLIDRTRSQRSLEATPGAGFPGMDLTLERSVFDLDSHFLFWKPGSPPYVEPDGFSWILDPGNDLVLNTHLQPSGKEEREQPSVGLYFTDKPPAHFPLLLQLEHDGALDIPAADRDFTVSDDFRLPLDVDVLAVYPHAHYVGKVLEGYATLPDGSRKWLIRIPNWNLSWQAIDIASHFFCRRER
jgi:mono/diheme cytochrome c family protein